VFLLALQYYIHTVDGHQWEHWTTWHRSEDNIKMSREEKFFCDVNLIALPWGGVWWRGVVVQCWTVGRTTPRTVQLPRYSVELWAEQHPVLYSYPGTVLLSLCSEFCLSSLCNVTVFASGLEWFVPLLPMSTWKMELRNYPLHWGHQ
jgi:hypothetical protein